jgi:hypothetical protein
VDGFRRGSDIVKPLCMGAHRIACDDAADGRTIKD